MKSKKLLFLGLFLFVLNTTLSLRAQEYAVTTDSVSSDVKMSGSQHDMNFIKLNLTSLAFKTYAIQYERILNRKFSVALEVRTMPSSAIPFKNQVLNLVGDDVDTKNAIETFRLSNFAFTPEVRFYVGKKGYGHGFYIAPFYRYAKYKGNNLMFTYTNDQNTDNHISLSGELTSNTGGLVFGAQWFLGERLCINWWIFGPHYGSGVGKFSAIPGQPLTQEEQDDLRQQLEAIDIPLIDKTIIVNANNVSLNLNGPWGGIRAGLSIGVKF